MQTLTDVYNALAPRDAELEKQATELVKQAEEEDAAGRIMARGFADELAKLAAPGDMGEGYNLGGAAAGGGGRSGRRGAPPSVPMSNAPFRAGPNSANQLNPVTGAQAKPAARPAAMPAGGGPKPPKAMGSASMAKTPAPPKPQMAMGGPRPPR